MLRINTAFEPRLQRRYEKLVTEHLSIKQTMAAGLSCLPSDGSAFASTQAAWRFFQNQRVTIAGLLKPLLECAKASVEKECQAYALLIHDLTDLNYKNHPSKGERIKLNRGLCGYQLQSSLLISDKTGVPLSAVSQSLWTEKGIYTTRFEQVIADAAQLDELSEVIKESVSWQWDKAIVHIHDRGADSVGHYRDWIKLQALFLVRADANQRVLWQAESWLLSEIVSQLEFRYSREVIIKGVKAKQYIAETEVVIVRPAKPHRQRKGVVEPRKTIAGPAISLRLVVSQVRDKQGEILSEWLLYTNLLKKVKAKQIALWYYFRWEIESYFKLLKSAGQNLENWQQETPAGLLKRLLVASMACVVVWQLGKAEGAVAQHVPRGPETHVGAPRGDLRAFTHAVIDAGADLLLGHSPHVVRGMEVYKNRLIAYSLGNFAFYRFPFNGPTALSLILETSIGPNGEFLSGEIHPLIQEGQNGPRPDMKGTAIDVIRQLSKDDFGATAVKVAVDGTISAP